MSNLKSAPTAAQIAADAVLAYYQPEALVAKAANMPVKSAAKVAEVAPLDQMFAYYSAA
ncbi:hypothetical protein [Phaeovulum sp. W22_SRMD_FR3]|uniref:hypothetical protein n=1 Tax=Phaeovulum sp. W22_SRMD_FR3 TaxID=3240274 RepID=UPI003F9BE612